jgi:hypothetical protein
MQVGISYNVSQIDAIRGNATKLIKNIESGVPTAISGLMNQAKELASANTHIGSTKRLYQAWKVQQRGNVFSLYNIMPYAAEEFNRGGNKTGGNPPLGPHNIIPMIMDLLSGNMESTITKALMNGLTR